MAGFLHTPNDTIEELRRNLHDRYKNGYAVLKELIQNADDAGATDLHIAWYRSLSSAQHPLLQGPLLLIVNNGPFTYRDSYAIHLAGTGSKAHEEGKIGKFGLGLKSVFHLCEAFFYVSDLEGDSAPANEKLKEFGRTGILNPWDGARYDGWNSFSVSDRAVLRKQAVILLGGKQSAWFGVCLPLRKRSHCMQEQGEDPGEWAIEPQYYGDAIAGANETPPEDVFSSQRIACLMQMLPLMSTLGRVSFWATPSQGSGELRLLAQVTRDAAAHTDWRTMTTGSARVAGAVRVALDGVEKRQTYAGVQELLQDEQLAGLTRESDWPRMDAQTDTGRKRAPAAVKQHASVVVMEQPGRGALRVDRAVFLPLGDPPHPECRGRGDFDFEMMLHGYFFVDAGRLGVDFPAENQTPKIRQKWNRRLYEEGTLPLMIPALEEYARGSAGQDDAAGKIGLLTELLQHSECHLWRDHRKHICRDAHWCLPPTQ